MLGEMAASISHEIRNPLSVTRGFLQLFSEKPELSSYKGNFDLIIEELDRANQIISEFLSLARNKPVSIYTNDLNDIIQSLFPLLQAEANEKDWHTIFYN